MIQDKAKILADANRRSALILDEIRETKMPDAEFLATKIKQYCGVKLRLEEKEISDNIILMLQTSVAKALHIDITQLPGVDHPGQCGSASAVLSKKIQMFLAVQKGLNIHIDPKKTPEIQTIQEMAQLVQPLLYEKTEKREEDVY